LGYGWVGEPRMRREQFWEDIRMAPPLERKNPGALPWIVPCHSRRVQLQAAEEAEAMVSSKMRTSRCARRGVRYEKDRNEYA
jgi:hypothetical protein